MYEMSYVIVVHKNGIGLLYIFAKMMIITYKVFIAYQVQIAEIIKENSDRQ